jgi:hypothetical protein
METNQFILSKEIVAVYSENADKYAGRMYSF